MYNVNSPFPNKEQEDSMDISDYSKIKNQQGKQQVLCLHIWCLKLTMESPG